ncbi:MAG: hypothetical protein J6Z04_08135 [Clostridia bacterium]|nr:hypothetical protein [Clostridia bacterium]
MKNGEPPGSPFFVRRKGELPPNGGQIGRNALRFAYSFLHFGKKRNQWQTFRTTRRSLLFRRRSPAPSAELPELPEIPAESGRNTPTVILYKNVFSLLFTMPFHSLIGELTMESLDFFSFFSII